MVEEIYKNAFLIVASSLVGAFISTIFKPTLDKKDGLIIFILILFITFVLLIVTFLVYEILSQLL